jgi:hypothetical protein
MLRRASLMMFLIILSALVALGCGGPTNQAASTPEPSAQPASSNSAKRVEAGATPSANKAVKLYHAVHVPTPVNRCAPKSDYDFVDVVPCELGRVGKLNRQMNKHCKQYVSNDFSDPQCAKILKRYQLILRQVRANLVAVGVPTGMGTVAAALLRADRHDLQATRIALKARSTSNWPLFMRAWGIHGNAGQDLLDAGSYLSKWLYLKASALQG